MKLMIAIGDKLCQTNRRFALNSGGFYIEDNKAIERIENYLGGY